MASSFCGRHDHTKTQIGSNSSPKVRIVAKIRDFTGPEAEFSNGVSWISVNKPKGEDSEPVTLSFSEQTASRKESYELDYCYDQYEDNGIIFSREVKPLISGVLGGCNATVVAVGARGSGKTCLIEGSSEKPGLAALAMTEILSVAEEKGNLVTISSYEVYQDHVFDILDPERPVVLVQADAQDKIRLKGLSRVPVTSISQFYRLCVSACDSRKPPQKVATELPSRGHKGLIVHVSSPSENSNTLLGKLNFVDLAGYEGTRRNSIDGLNLVENSKIHRSIYTMLNVVHALSATGNHVPYRESKLTHLLQDSLGGASKVLMITCLKPSFCQDSMYMVNLVSRRTENNNRAAMYSTKKSKGLTGAATLPSHKSHTPKTIYATAKKQTSSRVPLSDKKINGSIGSVLKGRKLFDEKSRSTKPKKASAIPDITSTTDRCIDEEENSISHDNKPNELSENYIQEKSLPDAEKCAEEITSMVENVNLMEDPKYAEDTALEEKDVTMNSDDHKEEVTPSVDSSSRKALSLAEEDHHMEKDNENSQDSQVGEDEASPPISARLQELANNLKSLCSQTPSCKTLPDVKDASSYSCISTNVVEPKTPVINQGTKDNDRLEVASAASPWQTFSVHNSEVKHSLVQEYLSFLKSASKDELKKLKGIGEKRATYILEMREESPVPFKNLDDLKDIGLSAKQIKGLMKKEVGGLFS